MSTFGRFRLWTSFESSHVSVNSTTSIDVIDHLWNYIIYRNLYPIKLNEDTNFLPNRLFYSNVQLKRPQFIDLSLVVRITWIIMVNSMKTLSVMIDFENLLPEYKNHLGIHSAGKTKSFKKSICQKIFVIETFCTPSLYIQSVCHRRKHSMKNFISFLQNLICFVEFMIDPRNYIPS